MGRRFSSVVSYEPRGFALFEAFAKDPQRGSETLFKCLTFRSHEPYSPTDSDEAAASHTAAAARNTLAQPLPQQSPPPGPANEPGSNPPPRSPSGRVVPASAAATASVVASIQGRKTLTPLPNKAKDPAGRSQKSPAKNAADPHGHRTSPAGGKARSNCKADAAAASTTSKRALFFKGAAKGRSSPTVAAKPQLPAAGSKAAGASSAGDVRVWMGHEHVSDRVREVLPPPGDRCGCVSVVGPFQLSRATGIPFQK